MEVTEMHRGGAPAPWTAGSLKAVLRTVAPVVIIVMVGGLAPEALEWRRGAVGAGEWWRVVTGHVVHWTGGHLFWDLLSFLVLGVMALRAGVGRWWATVVGAGVVISAAVWAGAPGVAAYRGLSGIDCALLGLAAGALGVEAAREREWGKGALAVALVGGFVAKAVVDLVTGQALFAGDMGAGVVSVPIAHLVGAAWGLSAAVTMGWRGRDG